MSEAEGLSEPLPPPPEDPREDEFPKTGKCKWTYDKESRVLLADFKQQGNKVEVTRDDEKYLLEMMQRDDITVISDGLAHGLESKLYSFESVVDRCGSQYVHKIRKFSKVKRGTTKAGEAYRFSGVTLSMKVDDYAKYLVFQHDVMEKTKNGGSDVKNMYTKFHFVDHEGKRKTVDVMESVLYLLDLDVGKLLPELHRDLYANFELPGCLPGGAHCMMNSVSDIILIKGTIQNGCSEI